ncbi:type IV conjugative transfer system protein TraE, partial [Photobacterium damselae]
MRAKNKKDALQLSRSLNKFLLVGIAFLGGIVILLSGGITYLALNQPRTLIPPTITQELTVSGHAVSAS